jgi:hypothetical protein
MLVVPFSVAPFVLGMALGRTAPRPRSRFPLRRRLKLLGGAATGVVGGSFLAFSAHLEIAASDPDRDAIVYGYLIVVSLVGTGLGYILVGWGSHYDLRSTRRAGGNAPTSGRDPAGSGKGRR